MDTNTVYDPDDKLIPMQRGRVTLPDSFVEQFDITGEGWLYHEMSEDGTSITLRAANVAPLPPEHPLNRPENGELLEAALAEHDARRHPVGRT